MKGITGAVLWPMLREYWIFRWEWNVWHGYLPFFYKDNERKKKRGNDEANN